MGKKSKLPSTLIQPVEDSTDVTLPGMDAIFGSPSVEVDEEEEDDDDNEVNSFPPHQVQNVKDIILRKVTHDNLDLKALIRSVLFCDLCL